jgi:hypothetical protein
LLLRYLKKIFYNSVAELRSYISGQEYSYSLPAMISI